LNSSIANCGVVPLARIIELLRLGLGARDHFEQGIDGALGIGRQNIRRHRKRRDRRKVLGRIVGDGFVQRRIDDKRAAGEEERIAVGLGARDFDGADIGAGAGTILHDHGPPERLLQRRLQEARQHVGRSGGRKWHDDADRPIGAELCLRRASAHERGGTSEHTEKFAAAHSLFTSPWRGGGQSAKRTGRG
jgi:hypothetical protein